MTREVIRAVWLALVVAALMVVGLQDLQLRSFHLFMGVLVGLMAATLFVFAMTARRGGSRGGGTEDGGRVQPLR